MIRRPGFAIAVAIGGLIALTAALRAGPDEFAAATAALLYLLLAVIVGALGGFVLALSTTVVALGLIDWFFVPPYHRFTIADDRDVATLVVFVAVTALVCAVLRYADRRAAEARVANEQASAAERAVRTNEVRAALLSAVSHDLRSPLANMKTAATTLLVAHHASGERHLLETIDRSVDRLDAMVQDLLDASRIRSGALDPQLRPIDIVEALPSVLDALPGADRRVQLDLADELPLVLADVLLLERVLVNLLDNALFFAPGSVTISVRSVADTVVLSVIDHGPGFPRVGRDRLREAFQRAGDTGDGRGVGLGLSIASGFTRAMHGTLDFDDTPGGGATVRVRLPRSAEAAS